MTDSFKKAVKYISILLLAVGPYLLIFQGIDFTDKGLMLSLSTQLLKYPDAYTKYSHIWLSGITGYWWLAVFPVKGQLGLNIFFVLLLQLNAFILYLGLKRYFDRTILLGAICFATLISIPLFPTGFGYQLLTVLMLNSGTVLLFEGVINDKRGYVFSGAVIFAVSVFFRLTNILSLLFIIVIIIYFFVSKKRAEGRKKAVIFFAGFFAGMAAGVFLIFISGTWNDYINGLAMLVPDIEQEHNVHNPTGLLTTYASDLFHSISLSVKYCLLFLFIGYAKTFIKLATHNENKITRWEIIVAGLVGLFVFIFYDTDYLLKILFKYMLPGVLLLFVGLTIIFHKMGRERWLMLIVALMVYIISFAGSSTGMNPYGVVMLLCITIAQMVELLVLPSENVTIGQRIIRQAGMPLLGVLIVLSFTNNYGFVYRDAGKRNILGYPVNNKQLKGIYTTESRANCINQLLAELATKVKPGDTIWAAPHVPMIYALTGCVPFEKQVWENGDEVKARMEIKNTKARMPVAIVRAKGSARNAGWPVQFIINTDYNSVNINKVMDEFIFRYNYKKVWENNFFEVWTK